MTTTDLVFRSVGERTADLALELAIEHIKPNRVEVIKDIRPFSAAFEKQRMLRHDSDQVVYVDADCLILEDMVPYLERNRRHYVDCFVTDRFRGRIHCGVHITGIELVREMSLVEPPLEDKAYILRPESRTRNIALKKLRKRKGFKNFHILHDHFQFYRDIFSKYALRELRSRKEHQKKWLADVEATWSQGAEDHDIRVAQLAIRHARATIPESASSDDIATYIRRLPELAVEELDRAGIREKDAFTGLELEKWLELHPSEKYGIDARPRVFGLGLSRTGTRSLTMALHALGWDTVHYPADEKTFQELSSANYNLSLLQEYHGITDITVAPYFAQLDRLFPGSKFILTVRDREPWLQSCRFHWQGRSAFAPTNGPEDEVYMKMRRLLRSAVYGCYDFDAERFSWAYDNHQRAVLSYFENRPDDLLVFDICSGEGWQELCRFLGKGHPSGPFPHKGAKLTQRMLARHEDDKAVKMGESAPAVTPAVSGSSNPAMQVLAPEPLTE